MKFAFPFVTVAALGVLFVTAAEPAKSGKPVRGAPIREPLLLNVNVPDAGL